jgi:hypothetical protein
MLLSRPDEQKKTPPMEAGSGELEICGRLFGCGNCAIRAAEGCRLTGTDKKGLVQLVDRMRPVLRSDSSMDNNFARTTSSATYHFSVRLVIDGVRVGDPLGLIATEEALQTFVV